MTSPAVDLARHAAPPATPCSPDLHPAAPFARIVLGDRVYEVAEVVAGAPALAVRNPDCGGWMALGHVLADGWLRIGADIVQSDPRTLEHFLATHAVRQEGWYRDGDEIRFDTLGTPWSVRRQDGSHAEVRLGDAAPRAVDPAVARSADPRAQAIELLIAAYPDLGARFADEIDHWAMRLASGSQVTPIL